MKDLDRDPEIRAAKRRLHMWLGTSTTVFALVAVGFAFFLFARFGISPWQTLKLGGPLFLGIGAFLLVAWWFSAHTARGAARQQAEDPQDEQEQG